MVMKGVFFNICLRGFHMPLIYLKLGKGAKKLLSIPAWICSFVNETKTQRGFMKTIYFVHWQVVDHSVGILLVHQ